MRCVCSAFLSAFAPLREILPPGMSWALHLAELLPRDKNHLVPTLEHLLKQTHYTMDVYTKTEQSGDRVAVHKNLTDYMYLGGIPSARCHVLPYLAVSYVGLSPDFGAISSPRNRSPL